MTFIATGFNSSWYENIREPDSGKIVDCKDSVDVEKLIKDAAEEYDEDNKSRVIMNRKAHKFDKDNYHMPAYIRNKGDLDEPTFLRRQED